ncbi:hydroxymethylcytosylglucuronate/cytosylglucuronate synthase [Streptomyces sp. AV19]|uniref:hydroxymethylcytosylglucuronate/cytosylglucurona te synthase n=1 Tax=Streptomyces sp. AV19 TaxID=2793068 RepID=UPI0018FEE9E6|nr:hydroxymethylcytosylglucuronate/cytosylglucuronate synthase [Streptomyces sp. AV19]MBH1934219.1 hydroxymethylcytosylglucuronate/cytosylglucuronate synthase [Streptomyces sp. AV19]MDG4536484.1 hydroxymethylcytosylglucuronate/cytosylglucuronate synthase [Streptomyces sp. AV19]
MRSVPGPRAEVSPCRAPVTVAVAGAEFGWGSSGKLRAVMEAVRERAGVPVRFVGIGSGLGRPLLADQPVERWYDSDAEVRERVGAALVVLDGAAARALESAGVPTVFVDSLPFLWTDGDRPALPLEASVYCAQRCVELPAESLGVLDSVRSLRWVEAVVGKAEGGGRPAAAFRTALVSLGGLKAPGLGDWTRYPRLVVPAALSALAEHGVEDVHVAGNLPAGAATWWDDMPVRTTVGALPHDEFLKRLADCDVLLASPGLTTLLEAGSLGVPTVCLPPQNLSQIFNGRFHRRAVGAAVRVTWPDGVFREEDALRLRAHGEGRALELIYGGIVRARGEGLAEAIREALRHASAGADWGALASAVGTGGAAQVADELLALLHS